MKHSEYIFTLTAALIALSLPVPRVNADEYDFSEISALWYSDFETPSNDNVIAAFGGDVVLSEDTSKSHSGNTSLKASERENNFSCPAINITEFTDPASEYIISAYICYESTETDTLRISMKNTFADRDDEYSTIQTYDKAMAGRWIKAEEYFIIPEGATSTLIYFESASKTSTIWIDDIIIGTAENKNNGKPAAIGPSGTTVFDFEKPDFNCISAVRNAVILRSDSISREGKYSLQTGNRSDSRDGIKLDVSGLKKEKPFRCSSFITFTAKSAETEKFSMYLEYRTDGILYNIPIDPAHLTERGSWSVIGGIFIIPEEASEPEIVIASVRPDDEYNYRHVSFFLDNLTVTDELETSQEKLKTQKKITAVTVISAAAVLISVLALLIFRSRKNAAKILEEASTDSMTGALNRNAYETRINELAENPQKCRSLHFAVCDVNGLKNLNDNYGHSTGDSCIVKCAGILRTVVGNAGGKVYRTGGDEFVCIAENDFRKPLAEALETEEKRFAEYPFSAALGFSSYNEYEDGETPDIKEIIARCDKEMYLDKKRKHSSSIS